MQMELGKDATKQAKKNPNIKRLLDALRIKVTEATEQQLRDGAGTHLEPIKSNPGFLSIRVSQGIRAVCKVDEGVLFILSVQGDHDRAYGQGGKKGFLTFFARLLTKQAAYDYSTVQLTYAPEVTKKILEFVESVDPEDVYTDGEIKGKEDYPHITCLYGIKDQTPDKFNPSLEVKSVEWLGLSQFTPADAPYDVLIIKVEKSPELQDLFDYCNEVYPDNANSFPDYAPHTTIAYVKKGKANKYIEQFKTKFTGNQKVEYIEFSFNDRRHKIHQ